MNRKLVVAIMSAALASGCYRTTVHMGVVRPSVTSLTAGTGNHVSLIGIFEISDPIDLRAACPGGIVEIRERQTFFGRLITALVPFVSIMNPSIGCEPVRSTAL